MNNWLKAESIKIKNNILLWISLGLTFLFMIYIVFDPFPYVELKISSYLSSVFLLSLTVFGTISFVILGAFLSYQEYSWNTLHLLIGFYSRVKFLYYKSLYILLFSFLITVLTTFLSIVVHLYVGAPGQIFSVQIITQIFVVSLICFFWGELAFVLSLITKNVMYSVLMVFFLSFFEPAIYSHVNEGLLKYFIVFNQKGVLAITFSNLVEGSYIIVPDLNYPSLTWSIFFQLGCIGAILFIAYQYIKKCSIPS
ncbi:ABC transporter permease [Peribacillus sp. SI8-4]|uniref:ABC transporter permease n=1 Tax=Peribacillus sp. SI8-4 TaxID=3048009 RepID=UPI002552E99F|nr:ABC transporter permease [Peribacillus sp. SI8-4]